jgi:hypothetical protein
MLHPIPAAPGHTPKLPCPYPRVRRALSGATRSPRRSVEQGPTQSELKKGCENASFGRSYGNIVRRCGLCDSRQPWLVWCTRSLPKRSQCRIPALGIGGSPDEAQGPTCGEVPIKHLSPRPCPGVYCRCCAALLSRRAAGLLILLISHPRLHIAAPSPARLEKTKPRSAPGVAEQCQAQ